MHGEIEFSGSECSSKHPSSSNGSTSYFSDSAKSSMNEQFESTVIASETISLPKGLCENKTIFQKFFSLETWSCLSEPVREHLCTFLPKFTDNIEFEKNNTIETLFKNQITRFGLCPLSTLQRKIEEGQYRPEILKLNKSVTKAVRREKRFQKYEQLEILAHEMTASRECLLQKKCYNQPIPVRSSSRNSAHRSEINLRRARKRYFREIISINEQLGISNSLSDEDDDIYFDTQNHLSRKQRRLCTVTQVGAQSCDADARIVNTLDWKGIADFVVGPHGKIIISDRHYYDILVQHKRRRIEEPGHPELCCQEQKLKDIVLRTQASSGYRRIMPLMKTNGNDASTQSENSKFKYSSSCTKSTITNTVSFELEKLTTHCSPDLSSVDESLLLENGCESSQISGEQQVYINNNLFNSCELNEDISETADLPNSDEDKKPSSKGSEQDSIDDSDLKENVITQNCCISTHNVLATTNKSDKVDKCEIFFSVKQRDYDCNGELDMSELKDEITDRGIQSTSHGSKNRTLYPTSCIIQDSYKKCMSELIHETHNCFLSLVRDMFCSTSDQRLTIEELKSKLYVWLKAPIAALNDWYNQAEDKWDNMLYSAILFLSGEFSNQPDDFVPYIEYKVQLNIYQWIGASRDSDHRLLDLCKYWLGRKNDMGIKSFSKSPKISTKQRNIIINNINSLDDDDRSYERIVSPPPPRYPTDWSVRKATDDEIQAFRKQEKCRYENPHMAFTYKQHSYNSVVGPVKGIYTQVPGISKARGHNMLVADRPNFVTILTLVRDATARLPNGEGTRADICELLKSSQYISQTANDQVLQTIVSGALDRMHTEHDPCVKYDTKRKIWIYLHRNRSEEEFERLHQQYQGISKHKKPVCRKSKFKEIVVSNHPSQARTFKSTPYLEYENAYSDSNTDCCNNNKNDIAECSPVTTSPDPLNYANSLSTTNSSNRNEQFQYLNSDHISKINNVLAEHEHESSTVSEASEDDGCKISDCVASRENPMPSNENLAYKIQTMALENTQISTGDETTEHANKSSVVDTESQSMQSPPKKNSNMTTKPSIINTMSVSNSDNVIVVSPLQISTNTGRNDCLIHNFIVPVAVNMESSQELLETSSQPSTPKKTPGVNIQQASIYTVDKPVLHEKKVVPLLPQSPDEGCAMKTETFLPKLNNYEMKTDSENRNTSVTASSGSIVAKSDSGMRTADVVNTITKHKEQQSVLTPAQQKQILLNLLAQQNKPIHQSKSQVVEQLTSSNSKIDENSCSTVASTKTVSELRKHSPLTLASSTAMTRTITKVQSIRTGINVPPMIQIKSSNNIHDDPKKTKNHPVTVSEDLRSSQQNAPLIKKSISLHVKSEPETTMCEKKSKQNLQPESMKSTAVLIQTPIASNVVNRMLQSVPSVIHPANDIRTIVHSSGMHPVNTKAIKEKPDGQMIPLENLFLQDRVTNTTLQISEPKTVKTQLLQLSGSNPSDTPVAQYQLVSKNRHNVTVAQSPAERTTQTIITTTANNLIDSEQVQGTGHSPMVSGSNIQVKPSTRQQENNSNINTMQASTLRTRQSQLQQAIQHPEQPKFPQFFSKLTTPIGLPTNGKNGTSFINSPSINIATFGGGPLIIANKPIIRSDPVQQGNPNVVLQDDVTTPNIPNLIYGSTVVKEQGNSSSHVQPSNRRTTL